MFEIGKSLIINWKQVSESLGLLFSERKTNKVKQPMIEQIENFKKCLYLLNQNNFDSNSFNSEEVNKFRYKPYNVIERLEFIESNPSQYHSYIQLNELFKEIEKIYAKAEILEKINKREKI